MLSLNFFLILIVTLIVYWLLPKQNYRNFLLTTVSLGYVFLLDWVSGLFVLALTGVTFLLGKKLFEKKTAGVLSLSIVIVVAALLYFKYSNFLMTMFDLGNLKFDEKLFLPLGISYITFKHISYLVDIYWEKIEPAGFADFMLYSAFFPIYLAGPIERFENFAPQLADKINFSSEYLEEGYKRIVFGLFKKFVIADGIGILITRDIAVEAVPFIPKEVVNLVLFSFQIYFDFAAYSDIAIGSSRAFGFTIMENFTNPYMKSNISLFWNNWHISLSSWLRDYIFYPVSFALREHKYLNFLTPVLTMIVCGLWHGATTGFIIWGLWHGFGLLVYQLWAGTKLRKKMVLLPFQPVFDIVGIVLTFAFVTTGWLWFR
ncbi:MAG: MBOAT family protein [Ignavibacteria bacterium]|nr:MBOAT family protein [Ignavibacteria bacterium]